MYFGIRGQGKVGQLGCLLIDSLNGDGRLAGPLQGEPLRQRRDTGDQLELGFELADAPRGRDATLRTGGLGGDLDRDIHRCLETHPFEWWGCE